MNTTTPKATLLPLIQDADNALARLLQVSPDELNWTTQQLHQVILLQSQLRVKHESLKFELREALELRQDERSMLYDVWNAVNIEHSKIGRKPRQLETLARRELVKDIAPTSNKSTKYVVTEEGKTVLFQLGYIAQDAKQTRLLLG
jgi:hypothetical protein